MEVVAYAVVNQDGEVIVARTSEVAAKGMVKDYYPGARVVPLSFANDEESK